MSHRKIPRKTEGMVFDETGERLTPTYAVKKGTRYRYYVSTSLITGAGRTRSSGRRIPAGNLEGLVINRLRTFLADPGADQLIDAVRSRRNSEPTHLTKSKRHSWHCFAAWKSDPIASTSRSLEAA